MVIIKKYFFPFFTITNNGKHYHTTLKTKVENNNNKPI